MFNLSYILADRKRYKLLGILGRIKLVWWATCGRPIVHKVIFEDGITLNKCNRNVLLSNNKFISQVRNLV